MADHGTCQRVGCGRPATMWQLDHDTRSGAWACSAACWTLIMHPELAGPTEAD